MTEAERLVADYAGTGLTDRPPSDGAAARRAGDARRAARHRSAHARGRAAACAWPAWSSRGSGPGTAKGFVFLTLEDETGIANIIVRPDLFARDRLVIVEEPFLIVDGVLQNQDGVTSVRAEQVRGIWRRRAPVDASTSTRTISTEIFSSSAPPVLEIFPPNL